MKFVKTLFLVGFVSLISLDAFSMVDPRAMTCAQLQRTVSAAGRAGVVVSTGFLQWANVRNPKYTCAPSEGSDAAAVVPTRDRSNCYAGIYCWFDVPNTW